jgi:hypothetical protein
VPRGNSHKVTLWEGFTCDDTFYGMRLPLPPSDKALVHEALGPQGSLASHITHSQWLTAYLLCDGLGRIDLKTALEADFDWTHVRDSSPKGLKRDASYLRSLSGKD